MIKFILDIIRSRRNYAGNCYWAFRFTDCKTGIQAVGTTSGGYSNISYAMAAMGIESKFVYTTSHELPIREFNRLTADWAYAGCPPEDIAKFIKNKLKK